MVTRKWTERLYLSSFSHKFTLLRLDIGYVNKLYLIPDIYFFHHRLVFRIIYKLMKMRWNSMLRGDREKKKFANVILFFFLFFRKLKFKLPSPLGNWSYTLSLWGLNCHVGFLSFKSISQFSRSVVSDSLRPHESQHARPPCPSPTPGVHTNSSASS